MKRQLTFKQNVIIWMPYVLLKFLIQEGCLTKFLEKCNDFDNKMYLKQLINIYNKIHNEKLSTFEKKVLHIACFQNAFIFTNYWHRKYWSFKEFLEK